MSSLIALKPRAAALLRAAILFAAKDDVCERLTAVCIDPDPAAGRVLPIPGAIQQATPPAAVDPKLLGTICKAAELLDDRLKVTPHVRFFAADEHGPQCAAIASDAIAAVMPMRADSAEYADVYTAIF